MQRRSVITGLTASIAASAVNTTLPAAAAANGKRRLFIVSSYHREYLWSISTQSGLNQAMIDYRYLENTDQTAKLTQLDHVESSKAVIVKDWMDTKRLTSRLEIAESAHRIVESIYEFEPDLVFLGDDNATNYIGNQLLDTDIPVVFWGVNGLPIKYGLVDSMDNPGHNITGVWQSGYHKESLEFLSRVVPDAKTFAILACDSVTARANVKQIEHLAHKGELPLTLVGTVTTNSFETFKQRALQLQEEVDAFFVLNHDTIVNDDDNKHVDMLTVGNWYLNNIKKPEASHEDQFVREGMLLTANDSGYNQGYRAFEMAYDILEQGLNPSRMRTVTPLRGPLMINRQRAEMLGIDIDAISDIIEEIVETAIALDQD